MGAKHDKVKKERAKGRLRGKNCSMLLWVQNMTRWKKKGQRADSKEKIAACSYGCKT
jgi:hypothetical protein